MDYFVRVGDAGRKGHVVDVSFLGSNKHATANGEQQTNFLSQYIRPNQPVRMAHSYRGVDLSGLYAGIDLHFYKVFICLDRVRAT